MTQNAIQNNFMFANAGFPLIDVSLVNANGTITASGNTDIYTVPAGRRALIGSFVCQLQTSTLNATMTFKVAGNYYNGGSNTQTLNVAGFPGNLVATFPLILEAGETLAVWMSAALSLNVFPQIIEFSNQSIIKSAKAINLGVGNTLCYTAPAGKKAMVLDPKLMCGAPGAFVASSTNASASNINVMQIPTGQTVGTTFRITETLAVNTTGGAGGSAFSFVSSGPVLSSGDSIYVNSSAANNSCLLMNVVEWPN